MADKIPLSQAAYDRIKEEHDDLVTRGRIDIARKIEAARELGDLSENGDYHAAKEEQGKMAGRIAHLANLLENGEIVEDVATDTVVPGVVISLKFVDFGDDIEKYLLGSIEERVDGVEVVSPGSALGEAIAGARAGDTVSYQAPNGNTLQVEIVGIGD